MKLPASIFCIKLLAQCKISRYYHIDKSLKKQLKKVEQ